MNDREKYDDFEADMTKFLKDIPVTLYSVVIDKKAYWQQYPSQNPYDITYVFLIERLLFSTSDKTVGIQLADLYCYPVFHIFEYDKKSNEYWRFNELSLIKLYKQNGVLNGFGLKFFPDKTKKDLRFFEA